VPLITISSCNRNILTLTCELQGKLLIATPNYHVIQFSVLATPVNMHLLGINSMYSHSLQTFCL